MINRISIVSRTPLRPLCVAVVTVVLLDTVNVVVLLPVVSPVLLVVPLVAVLV